MANLTTADLKVSDLKDCNGVYVDYVTGVAYTDDGQGNAVSTGWTFELARWTGPFGLHLTFPWLNPLSFATHESAVRILEWARKFAPREITIRLDEDQNIIGPFTRTIERRLIVSDGARQEQYSCGMLANSIIRNGEQYAKTSFVAEWRAAGLQFSI